MYEIQNMPTRLLDVLNGSVWGTWGRWGRGKDGRGGGREGQTDVSISCKG